MTRDGIANAHDLAKRSGGRIPITTAYRLVSHGGRLDKRLAGLLEALCDLFKVEPGELLQREPAPGASPAPRPASRKRSASAPKSGAATAGKRAR